MYLSLKVLLVTSYAKPKEMISVLNEMAHYNLHK